MLQLNIREFAKATLSTFDQIFTSNFDPKNSLDCLSSEIEDERLSLNRPETVSIRLNHYRNFFPDACPADFRDHFVFGHNHILFG
jgi:hypothetical protein